MEQTPVIEPSHISAGIIIKGDIFSPGDLRIDGQFEGRIISKSKVIIGEKANITGDIIANNVDFLGRIKGNIYVKDTLSLKSSGHIDGDLNIRRLQVDLDAKFTGACKMISEAEFDKLTDEVLGVKSAAPAPAPAASPASSTSNQ